MALLLLSAAVADVPGRTLLALLVVDPDVCARGSDGLRAAASLLSPPPPPVRRLSWMLVTRSAKAEAPPPVLLPAPASLPPPNPPAPAPSSRVPREDGVCGAGFCGCGCGCFGTGRRGTMTGSADRRWSHLRPRSAPRPLPRILDMRRFLGCTVPVPVKAFP